jgi:hypothetical protein
LDRYAVTPPTIWTRETDEETGAIYRNGTMTETTSFIIPLDSFRIQSLQEHEIRVITRYGTTAGELTRHISAHYGANPRDLYLTVDGTPLENWDKVNSDYGQHILLRTRLRGGVRRSSRALAKLDVTKEMCTIRKGDSSDHSMGQQDEDRQVQVRAGLSRLRNRMWSQHHPLLTEMDRLLSEKKGTISQDDLKNLHHLSTDCSTRTSLQRGLFCQEGCSYTGMDPCPNQIPQWMRTGEGGLTEVTTGLEQDSAATYLKVTQRVPKDTFYSPRSERRQSSELRIQRVYSSGLFIIRFKGHHHLINVNIR